MATTIQTIEVPKKARALDTSGNNNHGQIYSGRGLEFDGVTDYLNTGYIASAQGITNDITVACWLRTTDVTASQFVFNFYQSTSDAFGLKINSSTIFINNDVDDASADIYATTISNNTWYRVVVVIDSLQMKLYLNGVLVGSGSSTADGLDSFTSNLYMGDRKGSGGASYFTGMMSDFQVWDSVWTAADVTYDYLNPESLALNDSGTSLTESNLKLWYPMQDGHRGQQSYILDGANSGIVSALVDHDFSTDTTGSFRIGSSRGDISYEDSSFMRITYNSTNGSALLNQSSSWSPVAGTTYEVKFRAKGTHAAAFTAIGDNSYLGTVTSNPTLTTDWQDYEFLVTPTSTVFRIYQNTFGSGGTTLDIDDITVQPINDKNHATTVFYGDELVTNGDMEVTDPTTIVIGAEAAAAADGTMDDSTAITAYAGSKSLAITGDSSSQSPRVQWLDGSDMGLVAGRTYYIECRVWLPSTAPNIDKVQLVVTLQSGAVYSSTANTDAWKKLSHTFVDDDITDIQIVGLEDGASAKDLTGDTFYVDSLTIKEVGVASGWTDADQQLHIPQPALQSYNELAWFDGTIASDGYVDLDSGITTSGNSWSLSFWIFHDDNGQAFDIVFGDGANQFIALSKDSVDKLMYRDSSDTYHAISDAAIPESEWVHITITAIANTSITAYVNGVAQATNSTMTNTTLLLERFMRGYSSALYHTFGTINEISYYNDVLTSTEVLDLFNDGKAKSALEASGSAGLVGYWRNNGLSEWKDLKGSNDGNKTAGVTETILIPQGVDSTRDNQGFIMNKEKDTSCLNLTNGFDIPYVDLGSETTIAAGTAGSFMMWLKPEHFSNNYFIGADAGNESARIASSTSVIIRTNASNLTFDVGSGDMVVGEWFHFAATKDTDNVWSIYIDGVQNGSASADTEDNDQPFGYEFLGARRSTSNSFNGQFDGVLVYESALSQPQIERNYNATKGSHRN